MLLSRVAHSDVLRLQAENLRAWAAQWSHEVGVPGAAELARHLNSAAAIAEAIAAGRPPPEKEQDLPQASESMALRDG